MQTANAKLTPQPAQINRRAILAGGAAVLSVGVAGPVAAYAAAAKSGEPEILLDLFRQLDGARAAYLKAEAVHKARMARAHADYPPRPTIYQRVGHGLDPKNLTYTTERYGKLRRRSIETFYRGRVADLPFEKHHFGYGSKFKYPPKVWAKTQAQYRRHLRKLDACEARERAIDDLHGVHEAGIQVGEALERWCACTQRIEVAFRAAGLDLPGVHFMLRGAS